MASEIINAHAYDVTIDNEGEIQEIQLWCLDRNSKPLLCRIIDYKFTFYGILPKIKNHYWDKQSINKLHDMMKNRLLDKDIAINFDIELRWKFPLYYYTEKKKPVILITCNKKQDAIMITKFCRRFYINYQKIELSFVEEDIQTYNKMLSERNLSISDKFFCKGRKKNKNKISKIDEYIVQYDTFEKDESDWFSKPMILSYDIESYSHRHRAFPESLHPQDLVFSISLCFQRFMEADSRKNYVIIMHDCVPLDNDISTDIIIVNKEVDVFLHFFRLIREYDPEVIIGYNIFGFDYSYIENRIALMDEFEGDNAWGNISRLIETPPKLEDIKWSSSAYGDVKLNYISCPGRINVDMLPYIKRDYKMSMYTLNNVSKKFLGASKEDMPAYVMFEIHQEISEFYGENGLEIEDYKIVKVRSENIERKEYTLKGKKEIDKSWSYEEIKKTLEENNYLVAKYNIQDSILVMQLFDKLCVWINVIEMSNIVRITPQDVFTRGQGIRVMAQLYDTASKDNIILSTRVKEPIFSAGGKVEDPKPGKWDNVLCFDFNSLYPSIMIAYNICHTTLIRDIKTFDKDKYNFFHIEQEEPEDFKIKDENDFDYGAYMEDDGDGNSDDEEEKIKKAKKSVNTIHKEYEFGFIKNTEKIGLLPKILTKLLSDRSRTKKIKKQCDIKAFKLLKLSNKEDLKIEDITQDIKELIDFKESASSEDLRKNLKECSIKWMVQSSINESRQLAMKISANSVYGFTGAQISGKRPLIEASMAICSRGRELITESGLFLEKNFNAIVVYGDTDSTMVFVPGTTPDNHFELAKKMEMEINGYPPQYDSEGNCIKEGKESIFPKPLNLEFEKAMKAIFMKKKHYAYKEYAPDGSIKKDKLTGEDIINCKGILPARRDNNQWMREHYMTILEKFFDDIDIEDSLDLLRNCMIDAIELNYDLKTIASRLSLVNKMGSNYKSESYPLNVFSKIMKKMDKPIEPGERFGYVTILDKKEMKKGEIMRTEESFIESWEVAKLNYGDKVPENYIPPDGVFYPKEIDSRKYIDLLGKKLDNLFKYNYLNDLDKYKDKIIYYPVNRKRMNPVNFEKPMKFFSKILEDNEDNISKDGIKSMVPTINIIFDKIKKRIRKLKYSE